jgi:hypothetical protein
MLYVLDAGVLITANNSYYPVDRVPEFWAWLHHVGESGTAKIPLEFYEEVKEGRKDGDKDPLYEGYANDLTDDEIEQIGRDPFLIAYALVDTKNRCVVTREVSKPSRTRQNRHIPDVCAGLGVKCCDPFVFARDLGFSTDWEKRKK